MLVCKHFLDLEGAAEWGGKGLNGKLGELSSGTSEDLLCALGEAFPLQASLSFSVPISHPP